MTTLINKVAPLGYTVFLEEASPLCKEIVHDIHNSENFSILTTLTENNPWHHYENVGEHCEKVFSNIQALLKFSFVENLPSRKKYVHFFNIALNNELELKRSELLLISCAIHDLGKGQSRPGNYNSHAGELYLITNNDGTTSGKDHEYGSLLLIDKILKNYKLSKDSVDYIKHIVQFHDKYNLGIYLSHMKENSDEQNIKWIKFQDPGYYIDLCLHIIADEWGAEVSREKTQYLLSLFNDPCFI